MGQSRRTSLRCRRPSRRAPRRCWRCSKRADDLPLFSAARRRAKPIPPESAAEALLRDIRPDELSPREAHDLLYRLKALVAE
jgi:hypothetical protein